MALDELDRKIVQCLSLGTSSYEELAQTCSVTRNTIYRRIAALENEGIIENTLRCIINFKQMDITPVIIGARVLENNHEKAVYLLTNNKNVKFLWQTYGDHNISLVAFCTKGKEGAIIQDIRSILEGLGAEHICSSIGFTWEKMSFSPFEDQLESKKKIEQIIEVRNLSAIGCP